MTTQPPAESSRLFSDFYTPTAQHRAIRSPNFEDNYISQLRFDSILSQQIVIPDTYLLDGRFFMNVGPAECYKRLGLVDGRSQRAVEVQTRGNTLEESLALFLRRPDREGLNGFPFNFMTDEAARDALSAALAEAGPAGLRDLDRLVRLHGVAQGTAQLLREYLRVTGVQDAISEVDIAERGWLEWLAVEREGRLATRRYYTSDFDISAGMAAPWDPPPEVASESAQHVLARVKDLAYRSDVTHVIREIASMPKLDDDAQELEWIKGWYTRSRHRALARQHRCVLARSETIEQAPRTGPLKYAIFEEFERENQPRDAPPVISLPEYFIDGLRGLSGDDFGRLRREAGTDLSRWWNDQDIEGLRRAVDRIERVCRRSQVASEGNEMLTQVLAALGGAGVVGGIGYHIGSPASATPVLGVPLPLTIIGGIVTLAVTAGAKVLPIRRARRTIVEYGLWRLGTGKSV